MMAEHHGAQIHICDFCGKWHRAVEMMFAAETGSARICSECIDEARHTIETHRSLRLDTQGEGR